MVSLGTACRSGWQLIKGELSAQMADSLVPLRAHDPSAPKALRIAIHVRDTIAYLYRGAPLDWDEEEDGVDRPEPSWARLLAELSVWKAAKLAVSGTLIALLHTQLGFCCMSADGRLPTHELHIEYGPASAARFLHRSTYPGAYYLGWAPLPIALTLCSHCYLPLYIRVSAASREPLEPLEVR